MPANWFTIISPHILTLLPPKTLFTCRLVCTLWKKTIDSLISMQLLWRELCRRDYPDVYESAYRKSKLSFSWYDLYRSLKLWPELSSATETRKLFTLAYSFDKKVMGFQLLRDGVIGVHSTEMISYYNVHTLKRSKRNAIIGCFCTYSENDFVIACLNNRKELVVIFKTFWHATEGITRLIGNVKLFLCIGNIVYYVTCNDMLCTIEEGNVRAPSNGVCIISKGVMALGHKNCDLYILTNCLRILKLENNQLYDIQLEQSIAKLPELRKYNFLEMLDWQLYYRWSRFTEEGTSNLLSSQIVTIRSYGCTLFIGYEWGIVRIYNASYNEKVDEIIMRKPIKEYNLMNPWSISKCPILFIDIVEDTVSHNVVVAMPQKIEIINILNNN